MKYREEFPIFLLILSWTRKCISNSPIFSIYLLVLFFSVHDSWYSLESSTYIESYLSLLKTESISLFQSTTNDTQHFLPTLIPSTFTLVSGNDHLSDRVRDSHTPTHTFEQTSFRLRQTVPVTHPPLSRVYYLLEHTVDSTNLITPSVLTKKPDFSSN